MKKMRTIISLALAVIIIFSLTLSAFAADSVSKLDSKLQQKISDSSAETTFNVYINIIVKYPDGYNLTSKEELTQYRNEVSRLNTEAVNRIKTDFPDLQVTSELFGSVVAKDVSPQLIYAVAQKDYVSEICYSRTYSVIDYSEDNLYSGNYLYEKEFVEYYMSLSDYDLNTQPFAHPFYTYREEFLYYADDNDTQTPDLVLAYAHNPIASQAGCCDVFGQYVLFSNCIYSPSYVGYMIYVPDEDQFYTIEEAWKKGVKNIEHVFTDYFVPQKYSDGNSQGVRIIGDVDGDGKITITDATSIQYMLSGLRYCSFDDIRKIENTGTENLSYISDIDRDGERTIMDATNIQRKLAKLDIVYADNPKTDESKYIDFDVVLYSDQWSKQISFFDYCYPNGLEQGNGEKVTAIFKTYNDYASYFMSTLPDFDNDFFKDKALVYICRGYGDSNHTFEVLNIKNDSGTLDINMNELVNTNEAWTVMTDCAMFIAVDKDKVMDVTDVVATEQIVYINPND